MIEISKSPVNSTQTSESNVSRESLKEGISSHQKDVHNAMFFFIKELFNSANKHDFTKVYNFDEFYSDFVKSKKTGVSFTESNWYKFHHNNERHHLLSNVPDDVNLVDVIEMICDCVVAAYSRTGKITEPIELPNEVLQKAFSNTLIEIERHLLITKKSDDTLFQKALNFMKQLK